MPQDRSLLRAALVGYELHLAKLRAEAAAIQRQIGSRATTGGGGDAPGPFLKKRRKLSAAARKRIAVAQKKRWADWKKAKQ